MTKPLDDGYEAPELSIYVSATPARGATLRQGERAPDDLLRAVSSNDEAPEVLQWSAPRPEYEYPDPEVFVAPEDPARRVSGAKRVPKKTSAPGRTTRATTTKTKLTGKDAFGGTVCTCNLVCTCNQVCSCESVVTCSCVSDAGACTCDAVCSCQGVSSCSCQSYTSCSCQAEPY